MALTESQASAGSAVIGVAITTIGWALGGIAILALVLASVVVMVLKQPRTSREWAVALISTLVSSFGLGALAALYFGLHRHFSASDPFEVYIGLVAVGGMVFIGGLPGWVMVRIVFNTLERFQDKSLPEVVKAVKEAM